MKFLEVAHSLRILVHIMPPHSTHRLQPLDVGMFSLLSIAYSRGLNDLIHNGGSLVSMTKRLFWLLFRNAWESSFTKENIIHAFEKPGIWPHNPSKVLDIIKPKKVVPPDSALDLANQPPRTPMTCRAIRRIQKSYHESLSAHKLDLVFRASEQLAAQRSINQHRIVGLEKSIIIKKKKRRKGKKLNLCGEHNVGP
jgi:hypothetical protein